MTEAEYNQELRNAYSAYEAAKRAINIKFAYANNTYKVGDKFTDHIGTIIIQKIQVGIASELPCCVFTGTNLTANGTVSKKEPIRTAYGANEKKS